jgi:hypothetical protein
MKKPAVYATALDLGFANVVSESDWRTIGIYLRDCVAKEPPKAKRGAFKKWLKTQGFNINDIAALTEATPND